VPTALLGCTPAPCGQRCLLPHPEGDCLCFTLRDCGSATGLDEWLAQQTKEHTAVWAAGAPLQAQRREKDLLLQLFTCLDACHARAALAAEIEELSRAGCSQLTAGEIRKEVDAGLERHAAEGFSEAVDMDQDLLFDKFYEARAARQDQVCSAVRATSGEASADAY